MRKIIKTKKYYTKYRCGKTAELFSLIILNLNIIMLMVLIKTKIH